MPPRWCKCPLGRPPNRLPGVKPRERRLELNDARGVYVWNLNGLASPPPAPAEQADRAESDEADRGGLGHDRRAESLGLDLGELHEVLLAEHCDVGGDHLLLQFRKGERVRRALAEVGVDGEIIITCGDAAHVEVALQPAIAGPEVRVNVEVIVA